MTFLCVYLVCLDVYGVFVVIECCLFPKSGICLFCEWMKCVYVGCCDF